MKRDGVMTTTSKQQQKFSFIDVFSGAGGLSIGFKISGFFEPITAIEMSSIACKTYAQNLGVPVLNENLANTKPLDLLERAHSVGFKQIDLIIGGPPCKAFTTANRGNTKWEKVKERMLKEERVVENIEWFSYWKMIEGIKPQAFVAENVMGLRTRRDVLESFLDRVASIKYTTKICELDAQYFGVPQRRKRIFIIGIRESKLDSTDLVLKNPKRSSEELVTVEKAISDLPQLSNENSGTQSSHYLPKKPTAYQALMRCNEKLLFEHLTHSVHPVVASRFKYIPQGYNLRKAWITGKIPDEIMRSEYNLGKAVRKFSEKTLENMHSNIYRRLLWDNVSCTVTNARKTVLIHPLQDRLISVREAARLQSFPDWTHFYGGLDQQYQQIADAVPPLLAKGIANHVAGILLNKEVFPNLSCIA